MNLLKSKLQKKQVIIISIGLIIVGLAVTFNLNKAKTSLNSQSSTQTVSTPDKENKPENLTTMSDQTQNSTIHQAPNGLIVEDLKIGSGKEIKPGDNISIHYTGTLENGIIFDSSEERNQKFTTQIGVGMVIAGWDLGVAGSTEQDITPMKEGGERKLTIPADLAYGNRNIPGIPAGSTLIFIVKDPQIL